MRAYIAASVKQHCEKKAIKMCVIPGGLTPYLQAGDIGIYKSFKDHLSKIIDEWKRSDKVTYTRGGNPRPPSIKTVAAWVSTAWQLTPDEVVVKSIQRAGFAECPDDWFISRHDVYGTKFNAAWALRGENSESDSNIEALDVLEEAFDDIVNDFD